MTKQMHNEFEGVVQEYDALKEHAHCRLKDTESSTRQH